tara:strand:+ start:510 stop:689 length:180 start_codon:yes stop_codon:yes gene_type:complete
MSDSKKEFNFDKFVKDIQKREGEAVERISNHQGEQDAHPARKYNKLYRERWQNRIKYRR